MSGETQQPIVRQSVGELPINESLADMIAKERWIPLKSGWRPFESSEEAQIIAKERLTYRGSNWLLEAQQLNDSDGVFRLWLPYSDNYSRIQTVTYTFLFAYAKVLKGSIPVGLPI